MWMPRGKINPQKNFYCREMAKNARRHWELPLFGVILSGNTNFIVVRSDNKKPEGGKTVFQ